MLQRLELMRKLLYYVHNMLLELPQKFSLNRSLNGFKTIKNGPKCEKSKKGPKGRTGIAILGDTSIGAKVRTGLSFWFASLVWAVADFSTGFSISSSFYEFLT